MVQWLYENFDINIHAGSDDALFRACSEDHLEIVRWLYSLDRFEINLRENVTLLCDGNAYKYTSIVMACIRDNVNILKYLYTIQPMLDMNETFKVCCQENAMKCVQWIQSLDIEIDINQFDLEFIGDNMRNWLTTIGYNLVIPN